MNDLVLASLSTSVGLICQGRIEFGPLIVSSYKEGSTVDRTCLVGAEGAWK